MRKTILIMILLTILAVIFASVPINVSSGGTCPEGMISYWKLDEGSGSTASDSVGGNHGFLNGPVWTTGKVGNALSFDGNDYVDCGNDASLDISGTKITYEAWINHQFTPGSHSWGNVIRKHHDAGNWIRFEANQEKVSFYLSGLNYCTGQTTLSPNTWYHVVGTYDGQCMKVFVNGVEDGKLEIVKTITPHSSSNLYIGCSFYGNYIEFWKGQIDEVAIYNRALTPTEILQHYENGLEGKGYCEEVIDAKIDIDPNILNLKSKGKYITAYIELPSGYSVNNIDISTVKFNNEIYAESSPTSISDYDNDGVSDLMVKFSRSLVYNIVTAGDNVEITISGQITDGSSFEGQDYIKVIAKGFDHTDNLDPSSIEG
jgi:hypothetical protein